MTRYEMRRSELEISEEEAYDIIARAQFVTVATTDEDGMPYAVPLSPAVYKGKIYVHSTDSYGHKLDNFTRDARVCVTGVCGLKPVYTHGDFSTDYESAMAFGRIRRVTDEVEMRQSLVALCMKYLPEYKDKIGASIQSDLFHTAIFTIDVDYITGKRHIHA